MGDTGVRCNVAGYGNLDCMVGMGVCNDRKVAAVVVVVAVAVVESRKVVDTDIGCEGALERGRQSGGVAVPD